MRRVRAASMCKHMAFIRDAFRPETFGQRRAGIQHLRALAQKSARAQRCAATPMSSALETHDHILPRNSVTCTGVLRCARVALCYHVIGDLGASGVLEAFWAPD